MTDSCLPSTPQLAARRCSCYRNNYKVSSTFGNGGVGHYLSHLLETFILHHLQHASNEVHNFDRINRSSCAFRSQDFQKMKSPLLMHSWSITLHPFGHCDPAIHESICNTHDIIRSRREAPSTGRIPKNIKNQFRPSTQPDQINDPPTTVSLLSDDTYASNSMNLFVL